MSYKDKGKVSLGYSEDLDFNEDWQKEGLACGYEHCIENFPLEEKRSKKSCPLFGHNCPGGVKQVKECKKQADEMYDGLMKRMNKGREN